MVIQLYCDTNIKIGALGHVSFEKGIYFYVGSAMGASGSSTLINRVKRHVSDSNKKKLHWHIDYFLQNEKTRVLRIHLIPNHQKIECILAQEVLSFSKNFIKNFGSSDCKCVSHLFLIKKKYLKRKEKN